MPQPAYKKARQHASLWLAICFTAIVAEVGFLVWLSTTNNWSIMPWGWLLVVAIVPFVAAVVFGGFILARLKRRRIEALAASCRNLGFILLHEPTVEQKTASFAPLSRLASQLDLRHGADRLVWIAASSSAGTELLFEHEYTIGSGRFTQVVTHTVVAWPTSHRSIQGTHLVDPAPFSLAYHPAARRRALQNTACDIPQLRELGRAWRAYGDPVAAARFLTPAARTRLAASPVGERWYIGNGWVCCLYSRNLDGENLISFVKHVRHVLRAAVS
jgi:hypothetical protein